MIIDRRGLLPLSLTAAAQASTSFAAPALQPDPPPSARFTSREVAARANIAPEIKLIVADRFAEGAGLYPAVYVESPRTGPLRRWEFESNGGRRRWALSAAMPISPQMLGARGDGKSNDTEAFQAAAALIAEAKGGRLVIPPGEYLWGLQTAAEAAGKGFSFRGGDLIAISGCTDPVVIELQGCKITTAPGLRFGSFDPRTGNPSNPKLPYYDNDFAAQIGAVIEVRDNAQVRIVGSAELDGNLGALAVGGEWGDRGRQLRHSGVVAYNNRSFYCENIHAHHFALDGFIIGWRGLTDRAPAYPHVLENCRALYNGRQGLSWVGGNSLRLEGGEFSQTGKGGLSSAPGAGIDIEAEESICRNGLFQHVRCADNTGPGLLADQGDSSRITCIDCTLIGSTSWSLWVLKPQYTFLNCKVVGATPWLLGDQAPAKAAKVIGGLWSMDPKDSPNGQLYGDRMVFGGSDNVLFEGVSFTAAGTHALPFSGPATRYSNCSFQQEGTVTYYTRGTFSGVCTFVAPRATFDYEASVIAGRVMVNGRLLPGQPTPMEHLSLSTNDTRAVRTARIASFHDPGAWAQKSGGALRGDIVFNPNAAAGGKVGWICVEPGPRGVWKPWGSVDT